MYITFVFGYNSGMIGDGETSIRNIANNTSWFRDTPHRWADASLPLAYAMACVEVVSKMQTKQEGFITRSLKHGVNQVQRKYTKCSCLICPAVR